MKRVIQLGMIWLILIALGGCSMMNKQEESNIALSAEHEALCNSKNTLNKKLCRQTMGQLPKFESDINTYFKEKFNIDGFKLTGIHFPYDGFNRGGFNATFQLESDPYVMLTGSFDYREKKYAIMSINENTDVAGETALVNGILFASYYKTLPIKSIERDLETLNINRVQNKNLFYSYSGGRYLGNQYLVSDFHNRSIAIEQGNPKEIITTYRESGKIQNFDSLYKNQVEKTARLILQTEGANLDEIKEKFNIYIDYIKKHPEYKDILVPEMHYYLGELQQEKIISMYIEGEINYNE